MADPPHHRSDGFEGPHGAAQHGQSDPNGGPSEVACSLFAAVGDLVPVALGPLDRGGTLAIAGIHLSDIPPLVYADHLFQERQVRSVTANTRADGEELLAIAARIDLRSTTTSYPLVHADQALADLAHDPVTGAAVLRIA